MYDKKLEKTHQASSDLLAFTIQRLITILMKKMLEINEENKFDHDEMINKIKVQLPKEYHNVIDTANFFNENKFQKNRKSVLDNANGIIKELNYFIERFDIGINGNYKKEFPSIKD